MPAAVAGDEVPLVAQPAVLPFLRLLECALWGLRSPGEHGRGRSKDSEYLLQLREKQKARRIYGVLEKQFRGYARVESLLERIRLKDHRDRKAGDDPEQPSIRTKT